MVQFGPRVHFGERVWFRPLQAYMADKGDRDPKVMEERCVGTHGRNCDILCMTEEGVLKGNTVHRMRESVGLRRGSTSLLEFLGN